jgi:hypothetical protein
MSKLALILVASVFAASSVNADEIPNPQGCPQPERVSNSAQPAELTTMLGCPDNPKALPKKNSAGLPTALTTTARTLRHRRARIRSG